MFCQQCGKEILQGVKFCPHCGREILLRQDTPEPSMLKLTLSPTFNPLVALVPFVPFQLFFTVFFGVLAQGIARMLTQYHLMAIDPLDAFFAVIILIFFGFPLAIFIIQQQTYAKTQYRFYGTKLEYSEGFLNQEEKTIDYKNITEINLRKSIVQKIFNLGTVILSTPATGQATGAAVSGVQIKDIDFPDTMYKRIKELIDAVNTK